MPWPRLTAHRGRHPPPIHGLQASTDTGRGAWHRPRQSEFAWRQGADRSSGRGQSVVQLSHRDQGGVLPNPASDFNKCLLHRVEDRLGTVVNLQLFVDVAYVIADGLLADLQVESDLFVRLAPCHELQDLDLASGQPVIELLRRARAGEHVQHPIGDRAGHHSLSRQHGHDARRDRGRLRILEDVSACTRLQRLQDIGVRLEGAEDQDLHFGVVANDLLGRLSTIEARHPEIHQYDIGLEGRCFLDCVKSICRLADQRDPRILVQEARQPAPKQRLIVCDQDAGNTCFGDHRSAPLGILTVTVVPAAGRVRMVTNPPDNAARSRIPTSPMPIGFSSSHAMLRPLSRILTTSRSRDAWRATWTLPAPPCLWAFVSASWMMRYRWMEVSGGSNVGQDRDTHRFTLIPVRSLKVGSSPSAIA